MGSPRPLAGLLYTLTTGLCGSLSDLFGFCDPSEDSGSLWESGLGAAGGLYRKSAQVTLMVTT